MRRIICTQMLLLSVLAFPEARSQSDGNKFFFVLLKRPSNAPQLSQEAGEKLQEQHMDNIRKLHAEHKLLVAGPFMDDTSLRGIFVLQADSAAHARELVATDPAIKAGRLAGEVHGPWLIDASAIHEPADTNQGMEKYTLVLIKRAGKWSPNATRSMDLLKLHSAFDNEMTKQGNIAIAGMLPLSDQGDTCGVAIFRVGMEQAAKLMQEDPAVKAGLLLPEIHPWITATGVLAPGQAMR